jgi:DNA mismatch repair protein MutH
MSFPFQVLSPETETILYQRAIALAGKSLHELAMLSNEPLPLTLHQSKGWIGQLLEKHLGAHSGQLAQPDFAHLGIELKTLPINAQGQPCESTYICTAPIPPQDREWSSSRVWRKMAKILWIPIESARLKPIHSLKIGYPILWSPCITIQKQLQQDWEELTELMILGQFDELNAFRGHYLQIRPKAPNAKTFIRTRDHLGHLVEVVPKGFYVRTALTKKILEEAYC